MTFFPILPPWLFLPLTLLLIAGASILLVNARTAFRWRYAILVLLIILASARPGIPGSSVPKVTMELNVFFVVDTSASAGAEDYDGGKLRLEGMKSDINAIATELAGARFSLISFDNKAKLVLPLTTDVTALRTLTEMMVPQTSDFSQGSSISSAKDVLATRLQAAVTTHPERPCLVFYLGDGEQTAASAPEAFTSGPEMIDGGAVLGYGTTAGAKMRKYSFGSQEPGSYIKVTTSVGYSEAISVLDEKALQGIAGQLSVPYVHRETPGNVSAALVAATPRAISGAAADATDKSGIGRLELFWVPSLAAFGLALWQLKESARAYLRLRRASGTKP